MNRPEVLRELALFAGAGGGILAGHILGWRCVCAVERDDYAASVLVARQNDGSLDPFPIWTDVRTFDGHPWRGVVDVISGGFPCTDISIAGGGRGLAGPESSLWFEFARIIREVRPRFVFVENAPELTFRGLDTVLADLATLGYDAEWGVLGAGDFTDLHRRNRMWIVAEVRTATEVQVGHADRAGQREQWRPVPISPQQPAPKCSGWWPAEPDVGRMAHGLAWRVDRLRAIGNGQVAGVAATAFTALQKRGMNDTES